MIHKKTLDKMYLTKDGTKVDYKNIERFENLPDYPYKHYDEVLFITLKRDTIINMTIIEQTM